jgi:hypothetical protein
VGLVGQIGSGAREVWGKGGTECERAARNIWAGGARNVQSWLRPFGDGMDGQHTHHFLSFRFFLGTLRCDRDWIKIDCSIMRLFIGVLFSILDRSLDRPFSIAKGQGHREIVAFPSWMAVVRKNGRFGFFGGGG